MRGRQTRDNLEITSGELEGENEPPLLVKIITLILGLILLKIIFAPIMVTGAGLYPLPAHSIFKWLLPF